MTTCRTISSLLAVSIFAAVYCPAQGLYNASDLHMGADVFVDGVVVNTGRLENTALLSLTSHWENEGEYLGRGALELSGSGSQRLQHQGQNIATLIVNGAGAKYLRGSINVTKQLLLKNGILHLSSADLLYITDTAVVVGGSAQTYVDGAITTRGTGYKFFPVGKNGRYAPIELLGIRGESAEFSVEVFQNAPAIAVEDAIVRRSLYWQRKDLAGTFGGSAVAVDFDRSFFRDPESVLLVTGIGWTAPFTTLSVEHSDETDKVISGTTITTPLILLGEIGHQWGSADFYLSTTLSPNASRIENRSVKIFGERLDGEHFHFQVFNRSGQLIFESTSLGSMSTNGWDGRTANGAQLQAGMYPFRLTARDKTGRPFEKNGMITLIY